VLFCALKIRPHFVKADALRGVQHIEGGELSSAEMAAVVAVAEERVSVSGKHNLLDVSAPITVEQYLHYMKDPLYLRTMLEKDKNDVSEVGDWSEEGERKLKFRYFNDDESVFRQPQ
jgi:hypothetical protein